MCSRPLPNPRLQRTVAASKADRRRWNRANYECGGR
jgi:hypothetical protein